jgi:hypothetical protein
MAPPRGGAHRSDDWQFVERACMVMHDGYERAAARVGWETQQQSRKPWADVPDANKDTMRAAVGELLDWLDDQPLPPP